ncbi:alpha/beta fold hydrolase [Aspergillus stella-maris]|uniref:alpha/beta fold hydrolase n=1 Tax=Aspergillus stella-maris TaxID=1810926 RepID=UPI003CCC93CB
MAVMSCYHETANGTKTHYTTVGNPEGTLIVLIHGLGGSTETFTPLVPHLQPEIYRIVCVDLEGFGKTFLSSPDTVPSITRYVDDLESLMASLPGAKEAPMTIILIGHSLGGIIATQYAARHPENIHGLALLGSGRSIANIPAARERMLGMAAKVRAEGITAAAEMAAASNFPSTVEVPLNMRDTVRASVMKSDPEGYARACEAIAGLNHIDPDYSLITAPTLLLAGSGDVISPPERSYGIKGLIGDNAWVNVLEGVGHQFILQDLEGCVRALDELFDKFKKA